MAAKPRVTVRLAPSYLHALAYIAARDGFTPGEVAREIVSAGIEATLTRRNWKPDWQHSYSAWQAEQGAKPDRFEAPEQADYDALAEGKGLLTSPTAARGAAVTAAARPQHRPLSVTIAESEATIRRVAAPLAAAEGGK